MRTELTRSAGGRDDLPSRTAAPPPRGETDPPSGSILSGLTPSSPAQPGARSGREAAGTVVAGERYTIQEGDTLSAIAADHLGDERLWARIAAANPGIDPNRLMVGQSINLPARPTAAGAGRLDTTGRAPAARDDAPRTVANGGAATTSTASGAPSLDDLAARPAAARDSRSAARGSTYRVTEGDSLATIAEAVLGRRDRWREIWELNKDRVKNPDLLFVGTELRMPSGEPARKPAPTRNAEQPRKATPAPRSAGSQSRRSERTPARERAAQR